MIYLLIIAVFAFKWAFPRLTWVVFQVFLVVFCWELSKEANAHEWRDGWGHQSINGYGGDPCWEWNAEEHAWRYACERRPRSK